MDMDWTPDEPRQGLSALECHFTGSRPWPNAHGPARMSLDYPCKAKKTAVHPHHNAGVEVGNRLTGGPATSRRRYCLPSK